MGFGGQQASFSFLLPCPFLRARLIPVNCSTRPRKSNRLVQGCIRARPSSAELFRQMVNDFIEYWAAAKLLLSGGNPYSAEQLLQLQRTCLGRNRRSYSAMTGFRNRCSASIEILEPQAEILCGAPQTGFQTARGTSHRRLINPH